MASQAGREERGNRQGAGAPQAPLMIAAALSGASWGLAWAILAPYLRGLGYSGTGYGLLGASSVLLGAISSIAGGVLSDLWGAKRTAALGLSAGAIAYGLIATGASHAIAIGFAVNGIAAGLGMTAMQALAARTGSDERMHYTLSYYTAAATLGGAAGSFAGWLPRLASASLGIPLVEAYRDTLVAGGLLGLAAGLAVLPLRERVLPPTTGGGRLEGLALLLSSMRGLDRRFYNIIAVEAMLGFGAAMSIHNIDYYFTAKYGVDSAQLGTIFGLQQLLMASIMLYIPSLSDRAGGEVGLYIVLASASVPLLIGMSLTSNYILAATLYLARSILMNVGNPLLSAYTFRLVPPEKRGIASAFLNLAWTIPAGAGRGVGGALLDVDLELPLRVTAAIYTAAIAALLRIGVQPSVGKNARRAAESKAAAATAGAANPA